MRRKCGNLFEQLLALILALCAIPLLPIILIVFVLPNLILRRIIVTFVAPIFHPEFSKILTHRSTTFSYEECQSHTVNAILSDYILKGNVSLEFLTTNFNEKILNRRTSNGDFQYPELKQYVVPWMNFNFWKIEDNFDLSEHIKLYNENRLKEYIGEEYVTGKEFHEMREKLLNSQFPQNKSPWEIILVNNYSPEDPILRVKSDKPLSVMIFKSHHSIADAFAIKKLVLGNLFEKQRGSEIAPRITKGNNKRDSFRVLVKFLHNILKMLTFPIRSLYELMFINIQLMKTSDWNVPENKQAPAVHAFTNLISVSRVKCIKNELGVSFTTLLFHICNEAMQKMMEKKEMRLKDNIPAIFPLPLPNHPEKLRNHM